MKKSRNSVRDTKLVFRYLRWDLYADLTNRKFSGFLPVIIAHDYPVKFAGTLKNFLSIVKANLLNVIGLVKILMKIL